MVCTTKVAQLAKKWRRMTKLGRKHLTWGMAMQSDECCSSVVGKGHCVVYTSDEMRFEVPIAYLRNKVFEELLRMSQEEFGFAGNGRITLPCDAETMEYAMCLLGRSVTEEVEKAFLSTITVSSCHNASCAAASLGVSQQVAICSS